MKVMTEKTAIAQTVLATLGTGIANAQSEAASGNSMALELLPFLIISVFLAWANYFLAIESDRSGIKYVILTFIPIVGLCCNVLPHLYQLVSRSRSETSIAH
jgi:hypothetical protein